MRSALASQEAHLYEQIAQKITRSIDIGTLRPGDRIPSVRKLSNREGVSISTVLQAYVFLEDRGLVEARPQSGYYVRLRSREFPPEPKISSPPLTASRVGVSDLVQDVYYAARDPNVVPLGAAFASPDIYPTNKLNRLLSAVARRLGHSANRVDIPPGLEDLRRQIARRSLDWGCSLSSDEILTTCGCIEALNLCLRAVAKPGDTIAVESPTYYGILQIIEKLGMKALEIPSQCRDGISLEALNHAIERNKVTACLFNTNSHNPLGSSMPDENKRQLVEMLARKEIPLIEDDVYGEIYFGAKRPKVAKAFDKEGLVLLCSSFTKTLTPGYRVGWTAPGKFRAQVERLKLSNTSGTPTLFQYVIAEFLESGGYDYYLRKIRRTFAIQVQLMIQAIRKYFPEETRVSRPRGGYVVWVEFPKWVDSLELYRKALGQKISIAPGPLFSPKQHYRNFIRLNCGQHWSERFERTLVTLGRLVENQRSD